MIYKDRHKKTKAEIEEIKKEAAKKLTPEQLHRRKFCKDCLKYKTLPRFPADPKYGYKPYCFLCKKKREQVRHVKQRLINREIYTEGAAQPIIDKVIAGRQLISRRSLAKFLGVHERTVLRMGHRGEIPLYNFLGQAYFKKEDVEKYVKEHLGENIEIGSEYIS